ncbi:MAG: maleylpyruvate isomerase N-terminal domain-containing protein [Micromonosporaceae bacterium]|nr:maleylpyruvate isomerase N-terminal domain-containing protein [Micromonosporaceae bacterium]
MNSWNFLDPASKDRLLALVQREAEGMFALVGTDEAWMAPTGAGHWQARDVVGHLVDTTETYFVSFNAARGNGAPPPLVPLRDMAVHVDAGAQALRRIPQAELIARCRKDFDQMMATFVSLTDDEWSGLMVPHKYMGPLPAAFYAIFQLVDYAVHSWDIRQGAGKAHALAGDSADMLVPLCFILWSATPTIAPGTEPFQIGIRITTGAHAGDSVASVSPDGVTIAAGDVSTLPAVIEFDPASFVLTAYGRTNAGTVRGDTELAHRFLTGFFRI